MMMVEMANAVAVVREGAGGAGGGQHGHDGDGGYDGLHVCFSY